MLRNELFVASPRDISSRSAKVNDPALAFLMRGAIPPFVDKTP